MTTGWKQQTILDFAFHHWHPDRVFCRFVKAGETVPMTFGRLHAGASAYARAYRSQGLLPGDLVFIILGHSPHLLHAFLGALLAGCVPSFLPFPSEKQDPGHYWETSRTLFQRTRARLVVTESRFEAGLRGADPGQRLLLSESLQLDDGPGVPPPAVDPDAVAFLQHSSGTTGLKKGVVLTHRMVVEQAVRYARILGLGPGDKIVSWLPLYHDMGLIACFILPLMFGVELILMDPFEWVYQPALLFQLAQEHAATLAWLPNFAFQHLCHMVDPDARYDLGRMRAFISCSEPCKAETMQRFLARFSPLGVRAEQLQVCYAMAEAVFAVTQTPLGRPVGLVVVDRQAFQDSQRALPPVPGEPFLTFPVTGFPVPGLALRILDEERRPLPERRVGEIAIAGPCVFPGYFRDPESGSCFTDGFFLTGDLGFLADGQLVVSGRKKEVIISRGKNYYAHDIELITGSVDGVKPGRVAAFPVYNEASGTEDVIVVAERADGATGADANLVREIRRRMEQELDLPVRVRIVPEKWLCKTTSGKMSRADNQAKYLAEQRLAGPPRPGA